MSFTPRLTAPSLNNPYYYSNLNPYYANGMGMPNCTAYAYGRAYEILETAPTLYYGNAENWYAGTVTYPKGSTPALGSIICFDGGAIGLGHLAVVEEMLGNGVIRCSESGYNAFVWQLRVYSYPYSPNPYIFQGFIYIMGNIPPGELMDNKFNFVLFNRRRRWQRYG